MKKTPSVILLSRTDSIGDVVLTLPMAAVLKSSFPGVKIGFIGKAYTKPVIVACSYIDEFIDRDEFLAKPVMVAGQKPDTIIHVFPDSKIALRAVKLGIDRRIGTTNRIYHWWSCNERVKLSRRHSDLHEAQLNLKLLEPLACSSYLPLHEINHLFGLTNLQPLPARFNALLTPDRFNLILHPTSQGSAREWGLENFEMLIKTLPGDRVTIFISGTAGDHERLQPLLDRVGDKVIDISGQMNLDTFIAFIAKADGLVANSTGPLHIAAALGKYAFGIYPPMRPIHPGRWAPLGDHAETFVLNRNCEDCRKHPELCHCIKEISPAEIQAAIASAAK